MATADGYITWHHNISTCVLLVLPSMYRNGYLYCAERTYDCADCSHIIVLVNTLISTLGHLTAQTQRNMGAKLCLACHILRSHQQLNINLRRK